MFKLGDVVKELGSGKFATVVAEGAFKGMRFVRYDDDIVIHVDECYLRLSTHEELLKRSGNKEICH